MTKAKIRDALAAVLGFKPVKTVRQKLLVISVHALLWGLFLILPLFIYRIRIPDVSFYYREIINKSFLIILFYINFYFLLPRFFRNRRLFSYIMCLVAALGILCIQQLVLEVYFLKTHTKRMGRFFMTESRPFIAKAWNNKPEGLPADTAIVREELLTDEPRRFTGGEAGYGVAITEAATRGAVQVAASGNEEPVYVTHKDSSLEYISNYIDLQKLRLSKNINIHYDVSGPVNGLSIAPLLLITFIENAFKHGISYTAPSEIKIAIAVTGNELSLTVGNAITQSNRGSAGGVGLINARRRLDVIYPGRHMLDVIDNDHLYIVNLKIELDHES